MNGHLLVVTPKEMVAIEALAYADGCLEEQFMEEAGKAVFLSAKKMLVKHFLKKVVLLLGKGNNGGDALVAGRLFVRQNIPTTALCINALQECSPLFQQKYREFIAAGGVCVPFDEKQLPIKEDCLLVDGVFGTGLSKVPKEPYFSILEKINRQKCLKIAVDIPSGLCGESGKVQGVCIKADHTVFLGLPKWGLFLQEGPSVTGEVSYGDFSLSPRYYQGREEGSGIYLLPQGAKAFLPPILRTRHKFSAGYVVAVAGSKYIPGAALLSCEAAYRAGAGYVRLLHPEGMEAQLCASFDELVKTPFKVEKPQEALAHFAKANSCLVGPGLGREEAVRNFIKELLFQIEVPLVIDADGLYHFSELSLTSTRVLLTPHLGEMRMLLGKEEKCVVNKEFLEEVREYALRHRVYLLLKGVPTFLFYPDGKMFLADFGCPGMATAGSGDVLTGIIAALLAQGLSMEKALFLGCYLHGRAGHIAEENLTSYSLMAHDLIETLPAVFKELTGYE